MVLVACGQLCSSANLYENSLIAIKLISKAIKSNAKVLFLPEASDYIAKNANHSKSIVKSVEESPFVLGIQKKLKELSASGESISVSVGIHEPSLSGRVKNTQIWISPQGIIEKRYQKIHLFDIDIENGPIMRESESVEPGDTILEPFQTIAGKVGFGICYDIRFPELALRLRKLGAEIITYPSAFTVSTGAAHWNLLGRARAIDSQSYVIMAAQAGVHPAQTAEDIANGEKPITKRVSYGHAMIVDPWGTVLAECSDIQAGKEDICVADIDLEKLNHVRKNMPLLDHRRPDVFGYEI